MKFKATFKSVGKHLRLGDILVEIEGGLFALHYGVPGLQGSIYWPCAAVTAQAIPNAEGIAVLAHGSDGHTAYELAPFAANDASGLRDALDAAADLPDGDAPRRAVTLEHEWPYAEPWPSIRRLVGDLTRPAWAVPVLLPVIAPYAWLKLRREAARHAPEALEGFRCFAAGDFTGACAHLRRALSEQPEDYDAFYLLLHAHLRLYAFDQALACAEELGMAAKLRASHLDNDIRLLAGWRENRHDPLLYRETKDREGIGLIGQRGEALTMLRPSGKVRVAGREYSARTEGEYASSGAAVEVVGWDGVSAIVRPAEIE